MYSASALSLWNPSASWVRWKMRLGKTSSRQRARKGDGLLYPQGEADCTGLGRHSAGLYRARCAQVARE
jgi:hypothetical protein